MKMSRPSPVAPPDGGWGWLVVAGCALHWFFQGGMIRSFSLVHEQIRARYEATALEAALVYSLNIAFTMMTAPLAAMLCKRFTARQVAALGAALGTAGTLLSSFAPSISIVYLTYGVMAGTGHGLTATMKYVVFPLWFRKRLSRAMSIHLMTDGLGTMAISPLTHFLFAYYGYTGTIIVLSALVLHGFVLAMVLVPPLPARKRKCESEEAAVELCQIKQDSSSSHSQSQHEDKEVAAYVHTHDAEDGVNESMLRQNEPDVRPDTLHDDRPDARPDDPHDARPDARPDDRPDTLHDALHDTRPDTLHDALHDSLPDSWPDIPHDDLHDARPDDRPDTLHDALHDVPHDGLPDALHDTRPDTLPDSRPDDLHDVRPDVPHDARPDAPHDARPDAPHDAADGVSESARRQDNPDTTSCGARLKALLGYLDLEVFRSSRYVTFSALMGCSSLASSMCNTHLAGMAADRAITRTQVAVLLAVVGGTTICTKIISGILFDLRRMRGLRRPVFAALGVSSGLLLTCVPHTSGVALFYALWVANMVVWSGLYTQESVVLNDIVPRRLYPSALGFSRFFRGIGVMLGPTVGGLLRDKTGDYMATFYFGGILLFFFSAVFGLNLLRRWFLVTRRAKETQLRTYVEESICNNVNHNQRQTAVEKIN